jgi:hypothetical protein
VTNNLDAFRSVPFTILVKTIVVLLFFVLQSNSSHGQSTNDEKIILELEKQRNEAIAAHNEAFLSNLLNDTFYGVTASGAVVHKTEQLAIYKTSNPFVIYSADHMLVTMHDNTAVVTGILLGKSKTGSVIGQTRFIYVYFKSDQKWKVTFGQETVVIK